MYLKNNSMFKIMLTIIIVLIIAIIGLIIYMNKDKKETQQVSSNIYNMSFYEVVDYVDNVETYLAKSLISTSPEYGAESLIFVWREANLAEAYLSQIPLKNEGLSNTAKFLNQVSDYSYSLASKNIAGESLTQEDLDNLKQLHDYSEQLKEVLMQLSTEIASGVVTWDELTSESSNDYAQQVSNMSQDGFSSIEDNFHEYAGLIYDGAFSEHITSVEKKGLVGEEVDEEAAKNIAINFIGEDKIKEVTSNGFSENGTIQCYTFYIKMKDGEDGNDASIAISKIGGHVVYMNYNRDIESEELSQEQADEIGKKFLEDKGFSNMKETYYLKNSGVVTINYAYEQDGVVMYPDLIKLKIALDNGEVLGIETTGYLNSHYERSLTEPKISKEEAKEKLNKNLEIMSEGLAVIPTEYKTEILCWEFKGKVEEKEFLVYINVETGKEEDILVIVNTPNGTLTM
jgi:germination protein YpeB